jgi:hypothetical protein
MSDYGLDGDDLITDHIKRPIDMFEGLVFRCDERECEQLGLGSGDLAKVHQIVQAAYRQFWNQPKDFKLQASKSFPVTGCGSAIDFALLQPWPEPGLSVTRQPGPEHSVLAAEWPQNAESKVNETTMPHMVQNDQPEVNLARPEAARDGDAEAARVPEKNKKSFAIYWAIISIVAAVGTIGGLVLWAPWTHPPVLRPSGFRVVADTPTSATLKWAEPVTGPQPDKYLIWRGSRVIGKVSGKVTSYKEMGLTPGTAYHYHVTAVRGGNSSQASVVVTADTSVPSPSVAHLAGKWNADFKVLASPPGESKFPLHSKWHNPWNFTPNCATGACSVTLAGGVTDDTKHPLQINVALTLSHGIYQGSISLNSIDSCRGLGSAVPIADKLEFSVMPTAADFKERPWPVTSWTGTLKIRSSTTIVGGRFAITRCPAATIKVRVVS